MREPILLLIYVVNFLQDYKKPKNIEFRRDRKKGGPRLQQFELYCYDDPEKALKVMGLRKPCWTE